MTTRQHRTLRSRVWGSVEAPAGSELRLVAHRGAVPLFHGSEALRSLAAEVAPNGVVVVANREPYAHEWTTDGEIEIRRPASGLVTGMEPILRACGGTWVAYGGGSADRLHADHHGRVSVPPAASEYTLRRVWISNDEYHRYYSGFANEALWPLCHTAFVKPSFRAADWAAYQSVNRTFAQAALEEVTAETLLLIQDYHFALMPRLLRTKAPNIRINLFWHIPWPNPEVIRICPWKEDLLDGMLGADVVGFHTRQYCRNFLESARQYLDCEVDLDQMSITRRGHRTRVRAYPISVEWPYPAASREAGRALRTSLGIPAAAHVGVGVDRADYTKGLLERMQAIELLLEQNPSLAGEFVFVQLASPTRMESSHYRQLAETLAITVDRINERFGTTSWKPVLLQMRTFSPEEVRTYYAMANSAVVTPLHDGMNLVAKEYVASCADADGVLVLSTFAGAATELKTALLVNPYDIKAVADAIVRAIRMPTAEKRARMAVMRERIAAHSIYDWSAELLRDLAEIGSHSAGVWPVRAEAAQCELHTVER